MAKYESKRTLNFLGFLATILIATAILIAGIVLWIKNGHFGWGIPGLGFSNVPSALVCVANVCAYILAIFAGFAYARSKRSVAYIIVQIIATIIILFVIITSLFF